MHRFDFYKTKVKTRKLGVRVKEGRVGGHKQMKMSSTVPNKVSKVPIFGAGWEWEGCQRRPSSFILKHFRV